MITTMLMIHWVLTPVVIACSIQNIILIILLTFISTFALHSCNYIAEEMEVPFGEDPNDLPIVELMDSMNASLQMLMEPMCQTPPTWNPARNMSNKITTRCLHFSYETSLKQRSQSCSHERGADLDRSNYSMVRAISEQMNVFNYLFKTRQKEINSTIVNSG